MKLHNTDYLGFPSHVHYIIGVCGFTCTTFQSQNRIKQLLIAIPTQTYVIRFICIFIWIFCLNYKHIERSKLWGDFLCILLHLSKEVSDGVMIAKELGVGV